MPFDRRLSAARLGWVPHLDSQRAIAVYPLTWGWCLADGQSLNRHRVQRQPDRGHMQADPARDVHARPVEQAP